MSWGLGLSWCQGRVLRSSFLLTCLFGALRYFPLVLGGFTIFLWGVLFSLLLRESCGGLKPPFALALLRVVGIPAEGDDNIAHEAVGLSPNTDSPTLWSLLFFTLVIDCMHLGDSLCLVLLAIGQSFASERMCRSLTSSSRCLFLHGNSIVDCLKCSEVRVLREYIFDRTLLVFLFSRKSRQKLMHACAVVICLRVI